MTNATGEQSHSEVYLFTMVYLSKEQRKEVSKERGEERLLESMTGTQSPFTNAPASHQLPRRRSELEGDDIS
jgi:hypothetical protein